MDLKKSREFLQIISVSSNNFWTPGCYDTPLFPRLWVIPILIQALRFLQMPIDVWILKTTYWYQYVLVYVQNYIPWRWDSYEKLLHGHLGCINQFGPNLIDFYTDFFSSSSLSFSVFSTSALASSPLACPSFFALFCFHHLCLSQKCLRFNMN